MHLNLYYPDPSAFLIILQACILQKYWRLLQFGFQHTALEENPQNVTKSTSKIGEDLNLHKVYYYYYYYADTILYWTLLALFWTLQITGSKIRYQVELSTSGSRLRSEQQCHELQQQPSAMSLVLGHFSQTRTLCLPNSVNARMHIFFMLIFLETWKYFSVLTFPQLQNISHRLLEA